MSDKQILQAVYGELKSCTFGVYKNVIKELKLLGISSTNKEIEILHSIILQTNSLQKAIELADNLGESKKSKLHEKTRNAFNKEEEKQAAVKAAAQERMAKRQKKQAAAKEVTDKKAAREQAREQKLQDIERSNIYRQIDGYQIVAAKNHHTLEKKVNASIKGGWKPLGSMSVYHPGANIGGIPESFFQAMVTFKNIRE